ncbi:hypothetical protein [Cylindrospermopsis sp. CR12]|nr:hypothetical protein [Cylindrospermopsis sp. CR12]
MVLQSSQAIASPKATLINAIPKHSGDRISWSYPKKCDQIA